EGNAVGLAISGLAGGVIGGWNVSSSEGITHALTLDMGGTSCDISAVSERVLVKSDNEVAGLPLRTPSVDVKTIGAGGGSIAWIDDAGILHVGPQSAGADPGPAAYGKGGKQATVTDANLILGRLNPDFFLGGAIKLDMDSAGQAIQRLADSLEMTIEETALGIIRISTSNMVQAIREVTVERGRDPRTFVLVPFGGAGPTQAVDIADALDIDSILIPPYPGITSALGLVCSNLRVDMMRTIMLQLDDHETETLYQSLMELSLEARKRLINQGADSETIEDEWKIDMRYSGQSHELTIDVPSTSEDLVRKTRTLFEEDHYQAFGYKLEGKKIEWVTIRVTVTQTQETRKPNSFELQKSPDDYETRTILLEDGSQTDAIVYKRESLPFEEEVVGPTIIEQVDTTIYLSPKWRMKRLTNGNIWMRRVG
ncbi:MAG: hydantoinase/oxoprolinase family protein, partial [Candidatus Thorarchaeota archaeon]